MYVFQADTYCDTCGDRLRVELSAQGLCPADPDDERSYDSDDFPKGPFPEEETDGPDHCASDDCEGIDLGAYGLPDGAPLYGAETRTVGAILSSGLTEHGAEYLREMLAEEPRTPYQAALHSLWREEFADYA